VSNRFPPGRSQHGAALIVSLLMVALIGMLGISVMRVAGTERVMTGASEANRAAFHSAEAAAEAAMRTLTIDSIALGAASPVAASSIDDRVSVDVSARREGAIPEFGSSLRLFARQTYSVVSRARIEGTASERTIVTGASLRVPVTQ